MTVQKATTIPVRETDTIPDILARITALRAMRQLARETGDEAKADELSNEIYRLNELEQRIIRSQAQEARR